MKSAYFDFSNSVAVDREKHGINFDLGLPIFFKKKGKTLLVSSMVASTLLACVLITFIPQLMPLWMAMSKSPTAYS